MKGLLIMLLALLSAASANAQQTNQGFYFSRQSQIDSFPLLWSQFDTINGGVIINSLVPDDPIHDLTPLASIEVVLGVFAVYNNPALESLDGLQNIRSIHSYHSPVSIERNDLLTDLQGLNGLKEIRSAYLAAGFSQSYRDYFYIRDNDNLVNLSGLDSLRVVEADILIQYDSALIDLSGLDGLVKVDGRFELTNNPVLSSLYGMQQLRAAQKIKFYQLPSLSSANYFPDTLSVRSLTVFELSSINNLDLKTIQYNHYDWGELNENALHVFDGLAVVVAHNSSLSTVELSTARIDSLDYFYIVDNPQLTEISGLSGIKVVNDIEVRENPQLLRTDFSNIRGFDEIMIEDNAVLNLNGAFEHLEGYHGAVPGNNGARRIFLRNNDGTDSLFFPSLQDYGTLLIEDHDSLVYIGPMLNKQTRGSTRIYRNDVLPRIELLNHLDSVGGIDIQWNSNLHEIQVATQAEHVGRLIIGSSPLLQVIENFPNLKSIGSKNHLAYLIIGGCQTLPELPHFPQLDSIFVGDGVIGLKLSELHEISSMENVFPQLRYVNGQLSLLNLKNLPDYSGFGNIDYIQKPVIGPQWDLLISNYNSIDSTQQLTNLNGFGQIAYPIGRVYVGGLTELEQAPALCYLLDNGYIDELQLSQNAPGFNTQSEVEQHCDTLVIATSRPEEPIALRVYPNPSSSELYLDLSGTSLEFPLHIKIIDPAGRTVQEQSLAFGSASVSLDQLEAGWYGLVVRDREGRRVTQKIVVLRE